MYLTFFVLKGCPLCKSCCCCAYRLRLWSPMMQLRWTNLHTARGSGRRPLMVSVAACCQADCRVARGSWSATV